MTSVLDSSYIVLLIEIVTTVGDLVILQDTVEIKEQIYKDSI